MWAEKCMMLVTYDNAETNACFICSILIALSWSRIISPILSCTSFYLPLCLVLTSHHNVLIMWQKMNGQSNEPTSYTELTMPNVLFIIFLLPIFLHPGRFLFQHCAKYLLQYPYQILGCGTKSFPLSWNRCFRPKDNLLPTNWVSIATPE